MSKKIIAFIILIVLLVGIGSYFIGSSTGKSEAYQNGYNDGRVIGFNDAPKPDYTYQDKLFADYNKLVEDYNTLRESTPAVVQVPVYQPRTPVSCTSNTIGSYAYTNCY